MDSATQASAEQQHSRRRVLPAILVFLLTAATIAVGATGALFTDSSTVSNDITTGDVTLSVTESNPLPWSIGNMAPGDTNGAVTVPVDNSGSLELRYAITSTETTGTSPDLANQLDLWIWDESEEDDAGLLGSDNQTCDDDAPKDGTNVTTFLYEQQPLGTASSTDNLVGDPATGGQTGDRVLASGGGEVLCFYLELPSSTDNSYESTSTTVDLNFEAEQTANNG